MDSQNKAILASIVVLAVIAGLFYLIKPESFRGAEDPVMCTMEAKLCPDGSYVGRQGPQCEFAECPGSAEMASWKTQIDVKNSLSFKYPEELGTKYISTVDWPPQVQVLSESFACTPAGSETARAGRTEEKTINGKTYCVTQITEGAAGSIYDQYAYATEGEGKTLILTFTIRQSQCGNYNEPEKTACEIERTGFDIDSVINQIFGTIISI